MKTWLYEWDRKRWLKKIGGLPSGDLATTMRIATLVSQQPQPAKTFRASAWLTGNRDLPPVRGRLR